MKNVFASILIVLVIVGTVFGIKYQIDRFNEEHKPSVPEEKITDIIPTLTIPSLHDTYFETDVKSLFYDSNSISVSDLSNAMKLTLVVNNLHDKEYDIDIENGTKKIPGAIVKEYYQKLYGNMEYIPETFTFFENEQVCPIVYEYNTEEDYYLIKLPGCGGRVGPAVWKSLIKKDKETKENDKVYIDYYVASYMEIYPDDVQPGEEPVTIYDRIFKEKIYMGKEVNDSVMNDLIKQNQISKYRLTYQKQSDGKYYFVSGSWLENTLS